VAEIGEFCRKHAIDASFRPEGWLWSATNDAQVNAWESTVKAVEAAGASPFQRLTPDEVATRSGSARHIAGVYEGGCASLDPAALVRGLRRVALDQGVRIHELSPMVELERSDRLRIHTPGGSVSASRVVIATNAWASQLPELYGTILPIASDVIATARLPEGVIPGEQFMKGMCISDSRLLVNYYRMTVDGRVIFGKGGGGFAYGKQIGGAFYGPSQRAEWVAQAMRSIFPSLRNAPISESWVGAVDRSLDGLPFLTQLGRPDLLAGAGFSGNGVGPSLLGGKILASMALGRQDEWATCGLARQPVRGLPPEPIRGVGGRLVRSAIARKELAEDEGRRPRMVDRSLARLAPPGLVPTD
jgi:glycine/D-amino acid oxidase-like deaminating enzyme